MDAILFADAHVSDADPAGAARLIRFLTDTCATARRVYILGDLFDFWCGPKQAGFEPYAKVLGAIRRLSESGIEVVFLHGNRDFYMDERTGARYGFRVVENFLIEDVGGRRTLLCHGDMLCTNDVKYHRTRAILRHGFTRAVLTRLPAQVAFRLARAFRRRSIRSVASKSRWVLGIDEGALDAHFGKGAEVIICGHTHCEGTKDYPAAAGPRKLYTLGDFGVQGSYLESGPGGLAFRRADF